MRIVLACVLLTIGCASTATNYSAPTSLGVEMKTYPHEVQYDLLARTTAEACATAEELKAFRRSRTQEVRSVGHPILFERAKYEAIENAHADGLIAVRAKVRNVAESECVTVTGRPYRITSIRATEGHPSGESSDDNRRTLPEGTATPESL